MVEYLLRIFNREWSGLHEAAFLLAGTALLSQALGLIRDRLLSGYFGAGKDLDVYFAAFRIPDLLYASIASFVAVTVLIPFFLERTEHPGGEKHAHDFINTVFTVFVVAMSVACVIAYVLIPLSVRAVVPGFSSDMQQEYVLLSRVLLLSPFLLGLSNLFGSVTQSLRRFFVFAAGPLLYNLGIIIGIIFLMPVYGLEGVVFGVLLGALMHVLVQLPVLLSIKMIPRFTRRIEWDAVFGVVRLSVPRTIALSATHLATIVLISFASRIEEGSIAIFTLAMNLQSIPLSIIGMSYSVAAFPTLAKLWTGGNREQFAKQIVSAMRHIMFWSFPAIVLFIVLRAQIVRTILGVGAFDWTATRLTAAALALFIISVVAQNVVLLLTRSFYAMGKTRIPLYANLTGMIIIIFSAVGLLSVFNSHETFRYFFETLLRVSDISGTSLLMLPLGYSIGMLINVFLLLYFLRKKFHTLFGDIKTAFLHSFTTSVVIGFVAYHGLRLFADILNTNTFIGIFLQGFLAGILGILAGIFLLRLMDNCELKEISMSLHRKFWRSKPIAAEVESL